MSKTTWIGAALAALAALVLVLWRGDGGRETSETSPEPVRVEVAGHPFAIPLNAVRFPGERRPGPQERLDLALLAPEWIGRTTANAARFDEPAATSDVVWVTISKATGEMDSAALLATVYSRFFEGDPLPAPDGLGLTGRRLAAKAGYVGEEVWFEPGAVRPFVARCWPIAPNGAVTTCLGVKTVGDLSIARRFPYARLGDWRALSDGLDARLAEWGVPVR